MIFDNCVSIWVARNLRAMIARLVRNINPYPLGAGVTAPSPGVRLVINRQNAGADCGQSDERR